MKQILDQFLQLLQQGIAAIFRFVGLVWAWSADQIDKILQVPLENWPLWKQILRSRAYALWLRSPAWSPL